jgi:hypothetical protein
MIFPLQWSGSEIIANLLLLPTGDPIRQVVGPRKTEDAFSQAQPVLRAVFLKGLGKPCWDLNINTASLVYSPFFYLVQPSSVRHQGLLQPLFKSQIFDGLSVQFRPSAPAPQRKSAQVKKDLPHSYRDLAGSPTQHSELFASGSEYACEKRDTQSKKEPVNFRRIKWGEVFLRVLRQPVIA